MLFRTSAGSASDPTALYERPRSGPRQSTSMPSESASSCRVLMLGIVTGLSKYIKHK